MIFDDILGHLTTGAYIRRRKLSHVSQKILSDIAIYCQVGKELKENVLFGLTQVRIKIFSQSITKFC